MGLEAQVEVILEFENFQLIEEMATIIHMTKEIALGTFGNFDFHSYNEKYLYIEKKINRLFKTFSNDITNFLCDSNILKTHMNLDELTISTAVEFLQNLKAVMEGQSIYVESPISESTKMKNDIVRLINSKLGGNEDLKEKVRKTAMDFFYSYFPEPHQSLRKKDMTLKYICERNTELYRRQLIKYEEVMVDVAEI
jgi:hypothetical protein